MTTFKMFTAITNLAININIRYFCASKLREFLPEMKVGILDSESPAVRPLAVQTTCPALNVPMVNFGEQILGLAAEKITYRPTKTKQIGFTVKMPEGAEDFTGDLPLSERINLLAYVEFFIGASSGLSWLAWANYRFCPKHRGTERAYECSRKISARQVIQAVNRLIDDKHNFGCSE